MRRNDNYWVFAGFGYFQIHPWRERAFVEMRTLRRSEREGERHNPSTMDPRQRQTQLWVRPGSRSDPVVGAQSLSFSLC
jgi:hypothetical protein